METPNKQNMDLASSHVVCGKGGVTGRGHICVQCGTHFTTRARLVIHDATTHGKVMKHECPRCGEIFRLRLHLVWHRRSVHAQWRRRRHNRKSFLMWRYPTAAVGRRLLFLCSYCGKCCHGRHALEWHRYVAHQRTTSCSYRKYKELVLRKNGFSHGRAIRCDSSGRVGSSMDVSLCDFTASLGEKIERNGSRMEATDCQVDGACRTVTDVGQCGVNALSSVKEIEENVDNVRDVGGCVGEENRQQLSRLGQKCGGNDGCLMGGMNDGARFGMKETVFNSTRSSSLNVLEGLNWRFTTPTKSSKEKYVCSECGLVLKAKKNLSRHLAIIHGYGKFYQCSYCKRRIRCRSELIQHIRSAHQTVMTSDEIQRLVPVEIKKVSSIDASSKAGSLSVKRTDMQQKMREKLAVRAEENRMRHTSQNTVNDAGVSNTVAAFVQKRANEVGNVRTGGGANSESIQNLWKGLVDNVGKKVVYESLSDRKSVGEATVNKRNLFEEVQRRFSGDVKSGVDDTVTELDSKGGQIGSYDGGLSSGDDGERILNARMVERVGDISVLPDHIRYPVWVTTNKVQQQPFIPNQGINLNEYRVHGTNHLYKCPDCAKHLKGNRTFRRHMGVMHGKGSYQQCNECGRRFRGPSELQRHMNVHSKHCKRYERKQHAVVKGMHFPCVLCPERFYTRQLVNMHRQKAHGIEGIATSTSTSTNIPATSLLPFLPDGVTSYRPHYTFPWLPSFYFRPTANFRKARFAMSETLLRKMGRAPLKKNLFINCQRSMRVDGLAVRLAERRATLNTNTRVQFKF